MFESLSLVVWVLTLVMPGDFPDLIVSPPMLTLEECHEHEARYGDTPFLLMCRPHQLSWDEMT